MRGNTYLCLCIVSIYLKCITKTRSYKKPLQLYQTQICVKHGCDICESKRRNKRTCA